MTRYSPAVLAMHAHSVELSRKKICTSPWAKTNRNWAVGSVKLITTLSCPLLECNFWQEAVPSNKEMGGAIWFFPLDLSVFNYETKSLFNQPLSGVSKSLSKLPTKRISEQIRSPCGPDINSKYFHHFIDMRPSVPNTYFSALSGFCLTKNISLKTDEITRSRTFSNVTEQLHSRSAVSRSKLNDCFEILDTVFNDVLLNEALSLRLLIELLHKISCCDKCPVSLKISG